MAHTPLYADGVAPETVTKPPTTMLLVVHAGQATTKKPASDVIFVIMSALPRP